MGYCRIKKKEVWGTQKMCEKGTRMYGMCFACDYYYARKEDMNYG